VTRLKKNAVYTVIETVQEHERIKGKSMVIKEEIIEPVINKMGYRAAIQKDEAELSTTLFLW
jgi:hypothetical protein